ncbi:MAG: FG-GAP repeat protein [Deltaproteobacteria bacterium]|nr:FG-GAP repeat protein [Deltaproteobacteria bacterium]
MLAPPSDAAGFGLSVAAIGDVNGDGFCDLAVGAPAALRDVGQVFIYHGSLGGLRSEPDAVLNGADPAMSQFGSVISGGGDVNGDGFADLIVGAPQAMVLGRAYVYYGSARGLSPTPSTLSPSDTGMAGFGVSIADVGDLDGDGFSDVVVGANLVDGWAGAAYVFCGVAGGPPPLPTARMTRPEGGQFGSAAAGAGDVDADGLPDFALSAPGFFEARGRAYLYPGNRARRWIDPAVVLEGVSGRLADFGTALASAGDVDGDGDDDLLVSAPRRGDEVGSVYLFAGEQDGAVGDARAGLRRGRRGRVLRELAHWRARPRPRRLQRRGVRGRAAHVVPRAGDGVPRERRGPGLADGAARSGPAARASGSRSRGSTRRGPSVASFSRARRCSGLICSARRYCAIAASTCPECS